MGFSYLYRGILSFCGLLLISLGTVSAHADDEDAILILDASGSMWGQIEGTAKIEIAKNVLDGLLDDLPQSSRLGLMAYGHNRKGDCSDIEMLAKVGASRPDIKKAVKGINPKGKTPISASVKMAAEKLKYTQNKATVILISDGIETCNLDPCALGKQLEKDGVDFTAHVVGFDIIDTKTEEQLQCLAHSTGGRYLSAASAGDLSIALGETVGRRQADAAMKPVKLHLEATVLLGGEIIENGLTWKVQRSGSGSGSGSGNMVYEGIDKGVVTQSVPPGVYDVFVSRVSDGLEGERRLIALRVGENKTVTIALNPKFDASVDPDREAVGAGSEFSVKWTGPDRKSDFITITMPDAEPKNYTSYSYTSNGNPAKLTAPVIAGDYEIRYVLGRPHRVLARAAIKVNKETASIKAAKTAGSGSTVMIEWTGPATQSDFITVVLKGADARKYLDYFYTKDNTTPHALTMPVEPGIYEIRYVFVGNAENQGGDLHRIIASQEIVIEQVEATLGGADEAQTGETISITWAGPKAAGDFITVTALDAADNKYMDYKYTKNGSPSKIRMPLKAGEYELRLVQKGGRQGYKVLARKPIKIVAVEANVSGPKTAEVGSEIMVEWTGPVAGPGDFITVTALDAAEKKYRDYAYTKNGSPAKISMPLEPGSYELRFVQSSTHIIARQVIIVEDIEMSLDAPKSANTKEVVLVSFDGPVSRGDWITIALPDAQAKKYTDYFYPRNGSPGKLDMPKQAGKYEIRYVLGGKRVVTRIPITVKE